MLRRRKTARMSPSIRFPHQLPRVLPLIRVTPLLQGRVEGLYIVLISLHGLVRGQHMELGKDADTGGQVTSGLSSPVSLRRLQLRRKVFRYQLRCRPEELAAL